MNKQWRTIILLCACYLGVCGETETFARLGLCLEDSDCGPNQYCKSRTYCTCKDKFVVYRGPDGVTCVKEASTVGDPCVLELQCTKPFGTHALCSTQGRCECNATSHFKEDRCYATVGLGGRCLVTNNCEVNSDIAVFCDKSTCVCPRKYHPNTAGDNCIKSSYIGRPCNSDENCVPSNSRCSEVCRCRLNYVADGGETRCLKAADKVGDECEEDTQCREFLKNAECFNSTCQCSQYHHSVPHVTACLRSVGLGGVCYNSEECLVKSGTVGVVTCKDRRCQCASGYVQVASDPEDCSPAKGKSSRQKSELTLITLLAVIIKLCFVN